MKSLFLTLLLLTVTGCVSEDLQREESAQEDPVRPEFLDAGIEKTDGDQLAREFDAMPDKPVKKVKRKAASR